MKLIVTKNYEEMSRLAAEFMAKEVNKNPEIILGLATGGTPVGMYKELINMCSNKEVDFSKATTINLDEYIGLSGDHNQSYRYFMNTNLFNHINVDKTKTYVPNGQAADIENECKSYDERIKNLGGIDLQLLGLGSNGHVAFNEPDEYLTVGSHETKLTDSTIEANARFFNSMDEVPKTAITMGLGGIMQAKKILVIANGEGKAEVVEKLMNGKITTEVPASMLQMHRDVTIIVDEAAAAKLDK